MTRKAWTIALAAVSLGLTLAVGTWVAGDEPKDLPPTPPVRQPKGTAETVTEQVNDVVQSVKRGAQKTADAVREEFHRARASVHDMGVQARIYSRLHWDKNLVDSKIELEVQGGVAVLRGTVKSLPAKTKAVDLARDTIGVDRVEDHLTVETASPTGKTGN